MHLPFEKTCQFVEAVEVAEGKIGSASIECLAGSVVTGGGFSAIEGSNFLVMNSALSGNGWTASARNDGKGTGTFNVHVVCLAEKYAGTIAMVTGQGNIASGGDGNAEISCPPASVFTGGGWTFDGDLEVNSAAWDAGKWRVTARNNGSQTRTLQADAVCAGGE